MIKCRVTNLLPAMRTGELQMKTFKEWRCKNPWRFCDGISLHVWMQMKTLKEWSCENSWRFFDGISLHVSATKGTETWFTGHEISTKAKGSSSCILPARTIFCYLKKSVSVIVRCWRLLFCGSFLLKETFRDISVSILCASPTFFIHVTSHA